MFHTFDEIEKYVLDKKIVKKVALCGAHDEPALSAVVDAKRKGIISAVLIGNEPEIKEILASLNESPDDYEIINEPDEQLAAALAIKMVKEGKVDFPMKGLMMTSSYMKAVLNKETGILPEGNVISMCTVFEYPDQNKLMIVTDCAVNITPDIGAKVKIIENSVKVARALGIDMPKVACLSALEKVNPKIASTVDADELSKMPWKDCVVEGPFALDNAVSEEAAKHKGIESSVGGKADVLLCSCLDMGNVIHKSINYFAHLKMAGTICGANSPVIMTSRTDSPETKYYSILVAILLSI